MDKSLRESIEEYITRVSCFYDEDLGRCNFLDTFTKFKGNMYNYYFLNKDEESGKVDENTGFYELFDENKFYDESFDNLKKICEQYSETEMWSFKSSCVETDDFISDILENLIAEPDTLTGLSEYLLEPCELVEIRAYNESIEVLMFSEDVNDHEYLEELQRIYDSTPMCCRVETTDGEEVYSKFDGSYEYYDKDEAAEDLAKQLANEKFSKEVIKEYLMEELPDNPDYC